MASESYTKLHNNGILLILSSPDEANSNIAKEELRVFVWRTTQNATKYLSASNNPWLDHLSYSSHSSLCRNGSEKLVGGNILSLYFRTLNLCMCRQIRKPQVMWSKVELTHLLCKREAQRMPSKTIQSPCQSQITFFSS